MDQRRLLEWVQYPERLEGVSGEELEQLLEELPAFEAGQLLNLRRLKANHSTRLPAANERVVAAVAQGHSVYRMLNPRPEVSNDESVENMGTVPSPETEPTDNLTRLAWFEAWSLGDHGEAEEAELAMGYAEALAGDLLEADYALETWVQAPPLTAPPPLEMKDIAAQSLNTDDIPVSESLAELHLRQGQRQRAAQIYRKLMLRFPAKTTYFAARLEQIQNDNDS
ncbi:MAG: hypothetical protein ACKO17_07465 [Bacteroidota bacterium]